MVNKIHGNKRKQSPEEQQTILDRWQKRLEYAYQRYDRERFDVREMIYNGTDLVSQGYLTGTDEVDRAENVRNVSYEMIESQIDTTIPMPSVKTMRRGYEAQAQMVEDSLRNDITRLNIQRINDEMERNTPVHGASYVLVNWNPDEKTVLCCGEIQLQHIHPKRFVPQPGKWEIEDMDYFFILTSVTRSYVKKRYDVDLSQNEGEQYPEINATLTNDGASTQTYLGDSDEDGKDGRVTEIICYYRDEDSDIGKFVFVNDTVLEDLPKFYHRRMKVCRDCGTVNPQNADECDACGSRKLSLDTLENEKIDRRMPLDPITYKRDRKKVVQQPQTDQNGIPMVDQMTGMPVTKAVIEEYEEEVIQERILDMGMEVPYYAPRHYPLIARINTPKNFTVGGQSDLDIIDTQQDAIKKTYSKIQGMILGSGNKILKLEDHDIDLTNEDNQIIEGNVQQLSVLKSLDLTANIVPAVEFAREQYQIVQSTLGINDSFQGKRDDTAPSGKAKQLQIQQSAGRLASKQMNKMDFFRQLYIAMFEMKLAFYDEMRPFITRNPVTGEDDWGEFSKYEFLCQSPDGEWYYNTDFLITADAGQGIPNDKLWLYEQTLALAQAQLMDPMQFWTVMESLHFPNASLILKQLKKQQEEAQAMAEQQAMMQQQQAAQQQQMMAQQAQPPQQPVTADQAMANIAMMGGVMGAGPQA